MVYKHYVVHPQVATIPALATCAAQQQGKFWEYKHALWELGWGADPEKRQFDRTKYTEEGVVKLAGDTGLNVDKFKSDMNGKVCKDQLQTTQQQLSQVGTDGTPTFYVNGRVVSGALPFDAFKNLVEQELKKADEAIKSGQAKPEDYYQKMVVEKGKKGLGS